MRLFLLFSLLTASIVVLTSAVGLEAAVPSNTKLQGAHGQRELMPMSCRACHRGMMMKVNGEEGVCLDCHGGTDRQLEMVRRGFLAERGKDQLEDIEKELRKPYRHPTLGVAGVHRTYEALPEEALDAPRHAECVDCHDPHVVEKERPFAGLPGKRIGNLMTELDQEYELCYRCHSSSANLPAWSTNKHDEFKITNPSYHPVEGEGRNTLVISLKDPYVPRKERPGDISTISCSDCHGSDDPAAPAGPHGSIYRGLLVRNYQMEDRLPESELAYALCYQCHDRASILADESFPLHAMHIQGAGIGAQGGTSCFTCHDAHGSTQYPYLIRFNTEVVRPIAEGTLEYKNQGVSSRHGSCTLVCHDVEHNRREY